MMTQMQISEFRKDIGEYTSDRILAAAKIGKKQFPTVIFLTNEQISSTCNLISQWFAKNIN